MPPVEDELYARVSVARRRLQQTVAARRRRCANCKLAGCGSVAGPTRASNEDGFRFSHPLERCVGGSSVDVAAAAAGAVSSFTAVGCGISYALRAMLSTTGLATIIMPK